MNNKNIFHLIRLLALAIIFMAGASQAISQSKLSDFDTPLSIIKKNDHLNVHEAEKLINSDMDLVILDVRKKRAYQKSRVPNALHADYFSKDFNDRLAALDKSKPCVVYCKSGTRSDETVRRMNEARYENISVIGGGFRAWRAAGKELEKGGQG